MGRERETREGREDADSFSFFRLAVCQGFFKVYAALFQYLAAEEAVHAGASFREYPTFGTSTTPWSVPSREETQVRFVFVFFSCVRSRRADSSVGLMLWWEDRPETSTTSGRVSQRRRVSIGWILGSLNEERIDASVGESRPLSFFLSFASSLAETHRSHLLDHLLRSRLMEKDNKAARSDARKEYNETVRVRPTLSLSLSAFLPCSLSSSLVLSLSLNLFSSSVSLFLETYRPSSPTLKNETLESLSLRNLLLCSLPSPLPPPPPPPDTHLANPLPLPNPLPPPPLHPRKSSSTSLLKTGKRLRPRPSSTSRSRTTTTSPSPSGSASSVARRGGAKGGGGIMSAAGVIWLGSRG